MKIKKYFGQHFLINDTIAEKITSSLNTKKSNKIIEIGPGKGALTKFLIEKNIFLKIIEIDLDCIQFLNKEFGEMDIIHKDFLKIELNEVGFENYSIIGNFPYNISSHLFLKHAYNFNDIVSIFNYFK